MRPSNFLLFLLLLLLCSLFMATSTSLNNDATHLREFLQSTLLPSNGSTVYYNFSGSPCHWLGVTCDHARVRRLTLENLHLTGTIPRGTLGRLDALTHLSLSANSLTGFIPSDLWNLSTLVCLSLSNNKLLGRLPPQIALLRELQTLDLSYNCFNGSIPSQLGELRNLINLSLTGNGFQGFLPFQLLNCTALVELQLSKNRFTGNLSSWISNMTNLLALNLSDNSFAGELPFELFQMQHLSVLNLSRNSFTGSFSLFSSWKSSLTILDLSHNSFKGQLPSHGRNFPYLTSLDLSFNNLVHSIPESIGSLTNLTTLKLSNNQLIGNVPLSLRNLSLLTVLDLHDNQLNGNVSFLIELPQLVFLNLSNNNWTGCFPPSLVKRFGLNSFEGNGRCQSVAANTTANSTKKSRSHPTAALLIGVVVGSSCALICMAAAFILCWRRGCCFSGSNPPFNGADKYVSGPFSFQTESGIWVANVKDPASIPVIIFEKPLLNLTFADLLRATYNFSKESQLTQGGFGHVYEAMLPGGLHVTIKVLIEGRILTRHEAASEFGVLSRIKHSNIVPLLGYCIVGDEKLAIYEYMENGGLHRWLYELEQNEICDWSREIGRPNEKATSCLAESMNWNRRHRVGLGAARALAFLHHGYSYQIVHHDVKASNVMLDADFEPHLANTGLGNLLAGDGMLYYGRTPGYVPPEYGQSSSRVTPQGDVYSFGVVLLELVTGKRPVGDFYQEEYVGNLVSWVRLLIKEKKDYMAVDPGLMDEGPVTKMLETLRIGYLCTQEAPDKRPTMQQVVGLLKDIESSVDS